MSTRLGWASSVLALAAFALGALLPGDGEAAFDKAKRRATMQGVVLLMAGNVRNDSFVPLQRGSGSIISADGAILTNHHVIWDADAKRYVDLVAVALLKNFDEEPVVTCLAMPANAIVKPTLDLALIKCERDLQLREFRAAGWPTVAVGSSSEVVPGDDVWVLGYPGLGGGTIHVTAGKVSGFQAASGGGGREWIKTDATIAHGSSGGTAVDDDGMLIGVPSAFRIDQEPNGASSWSVGLIRPIELAGDLVAAAKAGWTPGAAATPPPATGTAGGLAPGQKEPAPPPAEERGVTVVGRVRAADNDAAIPGALVIVLRPGVKVQDVNKDNVGEKFLTKAVTNRDGEFVTEAPVPRGGRYAVMVLAEGFDVLAVNDVLSTLGDVPDTYDPWGVVRLERD